MAYSQDSSQNEGLDLTELVQQYEKLMAQGDSFFFESDTFQEIIDYYNEHLDSKKALETIAVALEQHPFCAQFYLAQAQILMDEERYSDAQDALDIARRYEPTNTEFLLAQADLQQRNQQYEAALETLNELRLWADTEELLEADILEATLLEAQQRYDEALDKLKNAASQNPDNDWILSRVWLCAEWADKKERAIEIYQHIIDQKPYSYWAWYHLGYAYLELELYEKAVEALDYAIVVDESFELAYRDIVPALLALENYNEALRYLNDYSEHFELDAEMYEFMGECYEGKGDSVLARSYYVQSAQMNVRDGNCYFRLGSCYAKENNWKSALSAFELAYQTDNSNELYCLAIAEAQYEMGEREAAREFLLLATEKAPESAHVWLCYVEFLLYQEEFEAALEALEQAHTHCNDTFALRCGEVAVRFQSSAFQEAYVLLLQLYNENKEAPQRISEICSLIANHPLWNQWLLALKADN